MVIRDMPSVILLVPLKRILMDNILQWFSLNRLISKSQTLSKLIFKPPLLQHLALKILTFLRDPLRTGADSTLTKWCHATPLRWKILLSICINTVRKRISRKKLHNLTKIVSWRVGYVLDFALKEVKSSNLN